MWPQRDRRSVMGSSTFSEIPAGCHNAAFAFLASPAPSWTTPSWRARILGDGKRQRTRVFTELQSHYLSRTGSAGRAQRKGKVEGLVGFIRRNFLVPVPRAGASRPSTMLSPNSAAGARRRGCGATRRPSASVSSGIVKFSCHCRLLPMMPAISALDGRVRCRWSLPQQRLFRAPTREVLIRGYVDEVVISCGAEVIARHRRSYDSEDLIFDPLHYLPLIERSASTRPRHWRAGTCPRLAAAPRRMGKAGKRSTSRCSVYWRPSGSRRSRVRSATPCGSAIGFDAVKHLYCAASSGGRPGSTSTSIRICRAPGSR